MRARASDERIASDWRARAVSDMAAWTDGRSLRSQAPCRHHVAALLSPSSPALISCHPNAEATRIIIINEYNSGVLEGCLDPYQCRNVAGDRLLAFFDALNRGCANSRGFR
jgi:hypothetical protein